MENPISVANFFIKKSLEAGQLLTPMKVVKLVYIAHGWHLGLTGKPLLNEVAQAWKYGPVVPSVYNEFKSYQSKPITQVAWSLAPSGELNDYPLSDEALVPFLERIWDVYKGYTGTDLSALTHQENTPWYETWNLGGGKDNLGAPIPNPLIERHYKQLVTANSKVNVA